MQAEKSAMNPTRRRVWLACEGVALWQGANILAKALERDNRSDNIELLMVLWRFAAGMTFEDQIVRNKRLTFLLIFLFSLFIIGLGFLFGYALWGNLEVGVIAVAIAFVFSLIMCLTSYYGGKKVVLAASHARRVDKRYNRQLYNVLEEMSIASGLPPPELYIINDSAPNAFATGRDPQHAAIAVTTGLLDKLNRDELTGVIAHEMSHVRNFDIRYMMLMGVLVGLVALLSDFVIRSFFWGSGRRRSRGGGGVILVLLALVLAILAPLVSKLIQLAVSRRREFLADASAAQLTRYPEGLASALIKISNDQEVLEVANRATQHLYIINPIKSFERRAKALFSTHPPIAERVRRLRRM